jgi:Methylase involved in ubiquinone/menaquinone biosynthesis
MDDLSREQLDRPSELAGMFNHAAAGYDARPGYPSRVFDVLAQRCGLGSGSRVLEIGPGTGQATVPMLDLGAAVTAVEPGAELAHLLTQRCTGRALQVIVGPFETVELPDAAFDVVAAATSFHWVDPTVGFERCARCLRDDGWLALWWTIWGDPDRSDPFHDALVPILRVKAPHLLDAEAGASAYIGDIAARVAQIDAAGMFGPVEEESILWEGTHDPLALRAIFATFSAWIALPEPLRTEMFDEVTRVAREDFDGRVTRPYRTVVYTARRRRRP